MDKKVVLKVILPSGKEEYKITAINLKYAKKFFDTLNEADYSEPVVSIIIYEGNDMIQSKHISLSDFRKVWLRDLKTGFAKSHNIPRAF